MLVLSSVIRYCSLLTNWHYNFVMCETATDFFFRCLSGGCQNDTNLFPDVDSSWKVSMESLYHILDVCISYLYSSMLPYVCLWFCFLKHFDILIDLNLLCL